MSIEDIARAVALIGFCYTVALIAGTGFALVVFVLCRRLWRRLCR